MNTVLLLNASYEPLNVLPIRRAVNLLLSDRALGVEGLAKELRTPSQTFKVPSVIRLTYYVNVPRRKVNWSKENVLRRDNYTCIACGAKPGKHGLSVDHIIPKSRGGKNTWGNTACMCKSCNSLKGDRTPQEAGMKLLWEPKTPRGKTIVISGNFPTEWKKYIEV